MRFHDLPADYYPFVIEFVDETEGKVVHTVEVPDASAVAIPRLSKELGVPIGVRVTYANGKVIYEGAASP